MSQENGANQDTGANQKPAPGSGTRLILIVVALIAAGGGMFAVKHFFLNNDEVPEPGAEIDFARVTELRNLGLAWVENLEYDKAADAFR